jgi:predicted nucleotidyltransferase
MTRDQVIERLRASESELRSRGVLQLSLFGSVARGEARADSDVDVAVKLDHSRSIDLFDYNDIANRLEELLGSKVDLLCDPPRKPRLQAALERDRVHVF